MRLWLWISRHFNSRSSSEHCSRNLLNAVTKLSSMNAGQKTSSLIPKVQMGAIFVALIILKFQSVISAERTSIFRPERAGVASKLFQNISWCWTGSTRWKIFPWTRNSFFLLALNTNPARQEAADRQSKSKQSEFLLKSMLFWPELRSDECHFQSPGLSMLSYALMTSIVPYTNEELPLLKQLMPWTWDRVKLLQSPYFSRPFTPCF